MADGPGGRAELIEEARWLRRRIHGDGVGGVHEIPLVVNRDACSVS
jgi:hypothetical protein